MWKLAKRTLSLITNFLLVLLSVVVIIGFAQAQAKYTVLHSFRGGTDGKFPYGKLSVTTTSAGTVLYGVTDEGGGSGCYNNLGCGTVFRIAKGNERIVYRFTGGTDGSIPETGVLALGGKHYGVDSLALFEVDSTGETTLYDFSDVGSFTGYSPSSPLITDGKGNLYGTTAFGGDNAKCGTADTMGCGTVYQFNLSTNAPTQLYEFQGAPDGGGPGGLTGGLVRDPATGNLYGITSYGGTGCVPVGGCGTVFKLAPSSSGWTETVLYSFQGAPDGQLPAGLVLAGKNLYGFTSSGGANKFYGAVFEINVITGKETLLYSFCAQSKCTDGGVPTGLLWDATTKTLYGVTESGGKNGFGMFFQFQVATKTYTDVYDFTGTANGQGPLGLARDGLGNFYGVAAGGRTNNNCKFGCGIVYQLTP